MTGAPSASDQFRFQPFIEAIHGGVMRAPGAPEDGNLVWSVDMEIADGAQSAVLDHVTDRSFPSQG